MTNEIKKLIEDKTEFRICERCDGAGEIDVFCGHESSDYCTKCDGAGIIKCEPFENFSDMVINHK